MFRRKPTHFPCPICGAPKGEPCRDFRKRERKAHKERRELASSVNRLESRLLPQERRSA